MTPLDTFIARWTAAAISVPFFDVINTPVELEAMPAKWASAIYHTPTRVDVTMGSAPFVQEDGTIIVALFARAGEGRDALDAAINEVRAAYAGYEADECLYVSVNGPEDLNPETDGNWWQVALTVPYEVYTRRAAAAP